jgi:hypothetical protein
MWFITANEANGYPGPYSEREAATEAGLPIAADTNTDVALLHFQYDSEAKVPTAMAVIKSCGCVKNDPKFNRLGDYERKCKDHNDK